MKNIKTSRSILMKQINRASAVGEKDYATNVSSISNNDLVLVPGK